jgi:hypothetical protein
MTPDQLRAQLTSGQAETCPNILVDDRASISKAPKIEVYIDRIVPSTVQ